MRGFISVSRTIWLLSLVSLFTDLSSELLYPVMPAYLKSIGFSVFLIGLLEGLAEAIAGLSKGYFGNLSDSKGKRLPFVQAGYGLSAIAKIILAYFNGFLPVFVSRLTDRTGKGIRTSPRDAMLSSASPEGKKGEVFGFHRGMDTLGAVLGPLISLIYLYFNPGEYRTLFLFAIFPALSGFIITLLIKERSGPNVKQNKNPVGFFSFISYWKKAPVTYKQIVTLLLFFGLCNSADIFLLMLIKQKGFDDVTMLSLYIFYNLIYALMAIPAGKIADLIGIKKVIAAGIFCFVLAYSAISFVQTLPGIIFIFFVYGLFAACVESNAKAFITNTCEKKDTATALGFYSGFNSIALLLASTWTGWLWMQSGSMLPMVISSCGAFITLCLLLLTTKRYAVN